MTPTRPSSDAGFSLVEALVALFVLAIASAGLLRATTAHLDIVGDLEARAAAQWVAENRLAELRAGAAAASGSPTPVEMLGAYWRVTVTSRPSDDPDLLRVEVAVSEADEIEPLVALTGFVDREAAP